MQGDHGRLVATHAFAGVGHDERAGTGPGRERGARQIREALKFRSSSAMVLVNGAIRNFEVIAVRVAQALLVGVIGSVGSTPALAQYGCTTAACQSAMTSLNQSNAENQSTSTTGNLTGSSTIMCMKAVSQVAAGGVKDYTKDWEALYNANHSKGMTQKQAKAQILAQWYGKFIQGVSKQRQFCQTGVKNALIVR